MKNRRPARAAIAFFAVMLVLTFCSRTIYRTTLPRVRVEAATGGVLSYRYDLTDFALRAEEYAYAYLPFPLEQSLTVETVWVKPGDVVQAGDALVSFYAPEGEHLALSANAAALSAEAELSRLESAIASAREELVQRLDGRQTREQAAAIRAEIDRLDAGFYEGKSIAQARETVKQAREYADIFTSLQNDGWVLRAQATSTICGVSTCEGAAYGGLSPLCSLAALNQEIYLYAVLAGAPDARGAQWQISAVLETDGGAVPARIVPAGGGAVRVYLDGACAPGDVLSLTVRLQSPYRQTLLPLEAVRNNHVFVLEAATGDWGEMVYTVREKSVITGESDGVHISVLDGLSPGDKIVVSTGESLSDGQSVLVDGI